MGLANVSMVASFFWQVVTLSPRIETKSGKTVKIFDYALKIWDFFLKSPRFPTPGTFLGNRIKVEIYTDACARSPFETTSTNRDSWVGIGWILVIDGKIVEFFSLEVGENTPIG